MANAPFDRTITNLREKPLSSDVNQALSQGDYALRFLAEQFLTGRVSAASDAPAALSGFMGAGFQIIPDSPVSMDVFVRRGLGFFFNAADVPSGIDTIVGLDDLSPYKPVVLMTDMMFTVPAPPGVGNSRKDIIEARVRRETTNNQARQILDPVTGAFGANNVDKTLAFTLDGSTGYVISPAASTAALSYKQGVAALTGTEIEPTATVGYVKIGVINVGPGVLSIDRDVIVDRRKILGPGGIVEVGVNYRIQWNGGAPIITIQSMNVPPGMRIGVFAGSQRGRSTVYLVGGEITGWAPGIVVGTGLLTLAAGEAVIPCVNGFTGFPDPRVSVTGPGFNTVAAASVPPFQVGDGSKLGQIEIHPRYQSGGTTNVTNVALEDLSIGVSAKVAF